MTLLAVDGLTVARADTGQPLVTGVGFTLEPGETLGIAGESGCGKSTVLLALLGIVREGLRVTAGQVRVEGTDMHAAGAEPLRRLRGRVVALVPQSAGLSLTPTLRVGAQVAEALAVHGLAPDAARIAALFDRVALPDPGRIGQRFPHELSGGQVQRVAIAMALACAPRLLLLDEPTTGLDATTQAGILDLLDRLRAETGLAMVCVSHDIGVLARLCARGAVMYAGRMVEDRPMADLLSRPAHPYTRALLASVPRLDPPGIPPAIPGRPPAPGTAGPGCAFAPRCPRRLDRCAAAPALMPLPSGGRVACHAPCEGPPDRPAPSAGAEGAGPEGAGQEGAAGAVVLSVSGLVVRYGRPALFARQRPTPVVEDVSLALHRGEILGLVGESGSGKSTILRAVAGLWPRSGGDVRLDGHSLPPRLGQRDRASLRRMQMVFQNPDASLNPRQSLREILAQPLRLYFDLAPGPLEARARALLADVRLDPGYLDRRPAQLSGGERQRVALARAFAAAPEVILCDEVTSALDVSVQASVLSLIRDLCRSHGTACLFVAHDLAVVAALCDRVAVLHGGRLVEIGPARQICTAPEQAYTRRLVGIAAGHGAPMPQVRPAPLPA